MEGTKRGRKPRNTSIDPNVESKQAEPKRRGRPGRKERAEINSGNLADYTAKELYNEIQYWKGEAMKAESLKKENKALRSNMTRIAKLTGISLKSTREQ